MPRPPVSEAGFPDVDDRGATDLTDSELLDMCRAGDGASWTALIRRYSRVVTTIAMRAGLSAEDAKDITQATFIALLESSTRIRQDERIASWLITVAQRKAWRARRRLEREYVTAVLPERSDEPFEAWERLAVLHAALAQLDGPCRNLLTALYLDPTSPSYAEVAARLGRAVGTIGPTRGRCLQKLRPLVGEGIW